MKDIVLLEKVQRRATKIEECMGKSYEERLAILNTLEYTIKRADWMDVFKILKGFEGINDTVLQAAHI